LTPLTASPHRLEPLGRFQAFKRRDLPAATDRERSHCDQPTFGEAITISDQCAL